MVFAVMRCPDEEGEEMAGLAVQKDPAEQLAIPVGRRERSALVLEVLLALPWAGTVAGHPSVQTLARTRVLQTMTVQANVRVQVMIP